MNEIRDLSPAERELLALIRGERDFSVTITRVRNVSTVKRVDVGGSLCVEGQAIDFEAAWAITRDRPALRLIEGGRSDG